jgi:N-acetylmuramoyl-L-alanine amidase
MREINSFIVHSTATPPSLDVGAEWIRRLHVEDRGWSDIGYHYVIRRNGLLEKGRPIEMPGAHVKGMNENTIGIVYVGGVDSQGEAEDNRTLPQKITMQLLLQYLAIKYKTSKILGHKECSNTECPSFDVGTLRTQFKAFRTLIIIVVLWAIVKR